MQGDPIRQYSRLCHYIDNERIEVKKGVFEPLTYDFLMSKYKDHIKWWNITYGDRPKRYLSKEDIASKLNFYDFLGERKFTEEISLGQGEQKRDEYLFCPWLSISEAKEIIDEVYNKIAKRKEEVETGKALEKESQNRDKSVSDGQGASSGNRS